MTFELHKQILQRSVGSAEVTADTLSERPQDKRRAAQTLTPSLSACKQDVHRGKQVTGVHTDTQRQSERRVSHLVVHSVGHDRRRLLLLGIAEGSDS